MGYHEDLARRFGPPPVESRERLLAQLKWRIIGCSKSHVGDPMVSAYTDAEWDVIEGLAPGTMAARRRKAKADRLARERGE